MNAPPSRVRGASPSDSSRAPKSSEAQVQVLDVAKPTFKGELGNTITAGELVGYLRVSIGGVPRLIPYYAERV
jgi:hypothetical protein